MENYVRGSRNTINNGHMIYKEFKILHTSNKGFGFWLENFEI